ncbi:MAG TPA: hypothetical protein VF881_07860, partial [Polyangiaceae bacterium]
IGGSKTRDSVARTGHNRGRMTRSRCFELVALGCSALAPVWPHPALADVTRAQVGIDYDAPVECPTRADFLSLVRARRPDVVVTDDPGELRQLAVVVRAEQDGYDEVCAQPCGDGGACTFTQFLCWNGLCQAGGCE